MMGRMQRNTFAMRGWLLAAAPLGISFDLVVGAVPALIGGCLSLSVAAVAFRSRREDPGRHRGLRRSGADGGARPHRPQ